MDAQALALDAGDQHVGVVLEEAHARHRGVELEAVDGVRGQVGVGGEARDGGVEARETADVPDVQAGVAADPIQGDGQLAGGVEGDGLAGARDLGGELEVGVGAVVDAQQVDDAGGGADGDQAGHGGRPVVGGEGGEVIVLGELAVLEAAGRGEARRLVELHHAVLQVDVQERIAGRVGRPLDEARVGAFHGDSHSPLGGMVQG